MGADPKETPPPLMHLLQRPHLDNLLAHFILPQNPGKSGGGGGGPMPHSPEHGIEALRSPAPHQDI